MNTAEIKLDLFRRLDSLDGKRLERIYEKIISLIASDSPKQHEISPEVKVALDQALESSKHGRVVTHEEAIRKTKEKYPNLFS
jgi:predicted transcriptional regulator